MKNNKNIYSLAALLAMVPAFAFADDNSQNINKLNAAKLLVENGSQNILEVEETKKENAHTALGILQSVEVQENTENFEKTYYAVNAKANLILQNYDEVIGLWKKGQLGEAGYSEELRYFAGCAYFCKEDYDSVIKILKQDRKDKENRVYYEQKQLLAQAYFKKESFNEAAEIYSFLQTNNHMTKTAEIDYARVLYRQKQYKKAYELASAGTGEEAWMIAGAAALAQKKYPQAAAFYSKCTGNEEALYLKAYSLFKNSLYSDAGKEFEAYVKNYAQQNQKSEAWNFAIQSWLMAGNYAKAESICNDYLKNFGNTAERKDFMNMVFKLGDVYSDQKKYDKAISLYKKYSSENDDFSAECMYKTAVLYEKSGNFETSSDTFYAIYDKNPVAVKAEESLFRTGEVLYLNGLYKEAPSKLAFYSDKFSKGDFTEKALYYEFDCYLKTENEAKAILAGEKFYSRYAASNYSETVLEELYGLYYSRSDYKKAKNIADKLVSKTEGSVSEEWQKKSTYMKKILSGGNKDLILAEADYESAGGKNTLQGREKGSKYAALLFQDEGTKMQAVKLAAEILTLQEKDIVNEREGAASNAILLADYFYSENRKGEAAEKYLKAAEYSRMNGDHEKAAFSLYTATECFVHLGKKGNANETASLLRELYPESKYSTAVRSLLK